jgi:hypothetical protein
MSVLNKDHDDTTDGRLQSSGDPGMLDIGMLTDKGNVVLEVEVRGHEELVLALARLCPGSGLELVKYPALAIVVTSVLFSDDITMKLDNVVQNESNVLILGHGRQTQSHVSRSVVGKHNTRSLSTNLVTRVANARSRKIGGRAATVDRTITLLPEAGLELQSNLAGLTVSEFFDSLSQSVREFC